MWQSLHNPTKTMKNSLITYSLTCATLLGLPAGAGADSLKERQAKVSAAVEKARPAVVCIQSRGARGMGSGSGVIVSADGLILTAAHVVDATGGKDGEGGEVSVVLPDGREVKGKVLGRDRQRDSAMVQITEGKDWPHAEVAQGDSIEKGEWCIAMGHPGGFDPQRGAPVRVGRVWLNNSNAFFRSDCTVSGGDSGGPLFDLEGRVIGIHSNISMNVSENRHVPIGVFHEEWERLKKGESWGDAGRLMAEADDLRPKKEDKPRNAKPKEKKAEPNPEAPAGPAKGDVWLGIKMDPADGGGTVSEIIDGSPAKKAGLELEDLITKIDGKDVGSTGDVASRVRSAAAGDKLKFTVKRGGKEQELEVTLAARP